MPLVNPKEWFQKAMKEHFALGAFNVNNMEMIQGILQAAHAQESPLILQASAGALKYAGLDYIVSLVETGSKQFPHIPMILHLDHGADFKICKACIDAGFQSVMIDGSSFPFQENIDITKEVVSYAHKYNVFVEAELGRLGGIEDEVQVSEEDSFFTNPNQAEIFVRETQCDSLAIAIGTSHGAYKFKGTPKLDFDRLQKIHAKIPNTPLVLHGASSVLKEYVDLCNQYGYQIPLSSGVPEEMIRESLQWGVTKVNIDTDLRLIFSASIAKSIKENPSNFDPRVYLSEGRKGIQSIVEHKIANVLLSKGRI